MTSVLVLFHVFITVELLEMSVEVGCNQRIYHFCKGGCLTAEELEELVNVVSLQGPLTWLI